MPIEKPELIDALNNIRHSLHELAQPLAAVTGLVDLLMMELKEDTSIFREMQLINQQLTKIMEIIAEIRRTAVDATEGG